MNEACGQNKYFFVEKNRLDIVLSSTFEGRILQRGVYGGRTTCRGGVVGGASDS